MIETLPMQLRDGYIAKECQSLYKCNERSGNLVNSINKSIFDPKVMSSDPAYGVNGLGLLPAAFDGFFDFTKDVNGVWIQNDSSHVPPIADWSGVEFNLSDVYINAVVVKTKEGVDFIQGVPVLNGNWQPRSDIGVAGGSNNGITNSMLSGMHLVMGVGTALDGSDYEAVSVSSNNQPGGTMQLANNVTVVVYVMWDGTTGTLSGKCLNLDGSVYNYDNGSGSQNFELSVTKTWLKNTVFKPRVAADNVIRITNGIYYAMGSAGYKKVPNFLDRKLSQWGVECVKGNKGWPDL